MNTTGLKLRIRQGYVWAGIGYKQIPMDVHVQLSRLSDGNPIALAQWDHYSEAVLPSGVYVKHDPGILLNPDDGIALVYMANGFPPLKPGWTVGFIGLVWLELV